MTLFMLLAFSSVLTYPKNFGEILLSLARRQNLSVLRFPFPVSVEKY